MATTCLVSQATPRDVIRAEGESQLAPHGKGNVYAPEIQRYDGGLRMWFGAQGRDGHDRIHLATSADGQTWQQHGVVLEDSRANHCNDPSVIEVNGVLFMYYTRAGAGVSDEIAVATSRDGRNWEQRGVAIPRGAAGAWDAFAVGRPAVLHMGDTFHLWYDGRKDLPPGAPDPTAPKSEQSQRYVGHATSRDGLHWEKQGSEPVLAHDAGGVQVLRLAGHLVMLVESRSGTDAAKSWDGVRWEWMGQLVARSEEPEERFGHVTPFLLPDSDHQGGTLFYGAAAAATWDHNSIRAVRLSEDQWQRLIGPPHPPEQQASDRASGLVPP